VKKLWLTGKIIPGRAWEVIGIYDKESLATKACVTEMHFVAPIPMNKTLPKRTICWPGAYFPTQRRNRWLRK